MQDRACRQNFRIQTPKERQRQIITEHAMWKSAYLVVNLADGAWCGKLEIIQVGLHRADHGRGA